LSDPKPAAHQPSEGVKYDAEKSRYDLIPAYPLEQLAKIYTFGATKYADHNWRKGLTWSRVFSAIMRHLWAFWRGEDNDPETGLPHVVHAAWGCFTLLQYMKDGSGTDDRYDRNPEKSLIQLYKERLTPVAVEGLTTSCLMCLGILVRSEGKPWTHIRTGNVVCHVGQRGSTTAVPSCECDGAA